MMICSSDEQWFNAEHFAVVDMKLKSYRAAPGNKTVDNYQSFTYAHKEASVCFSLS